jgi:hypothetical protein
MLSAFERSPSSEPMQRYGWPEALEEEFIRAQGPNCPGLLQHLSEHGDDYAAVFFLPYLYPPTLDGIRALGHRRWALIPALHDEPPAYLKTFARIAGQAPRLLWNTEAERRLGKRIWNVDGGRVVAMTVATEPVSAAAEDRPYLLYCGRIDVSKGCALLLDGFAAYKSAHPDSNLELILTGNDVLGIGTRKDVRYLGFVEEQRKFELMAGALAFVQPSSCLKPWRRELRSSSMANARFLSTMSMSAAAGKCSEARTNSLPPSAMWLRWHPQSVANSEKKPGTMCWPTTAANRLLPD